MRPPLLRLVAIREIRERVRARSFQVATAAAAVITLAAIVLPTIASNPLKSVVRIGLVRTTQRAESRQLNGAQLGVDTTTRYVTLPDERAADKALRAGRIQVALIGRDAVLLKEPIDPNDVSPKVRIARIFSVLPAIRGAPIPIRSVLSRPAHARRNPTSAIYGAVLIYFFVFMSGAMIITGVAQEKSSRVIEVVLATIPAKRLLAGKVIGIGIVALLQAVTVAVAALVAFVVTGRTPLSGSTGGQVLQTVWWFVLAYAFYACVYAAIGATVSRQEEAQNMTFPITVPLFIGYIAALSTLGGGEESRLLRVLSFLPPTVSIAMPARIAIGTATPQQVAIAIAVTLVAIVLTVRLAGRIYENSILRMGSRVKLRDALRSTARR